MARETVNYPPSATFPPGMLKPGSGDECGRDRRLGEALRAIYRYAYVQHDSGLRDEVLDRCEAVSKDLEAMGLWRQ